MVPETTEKEDYSEWAGIVADSKTWYEEFMALPIADDQMTEQELRQLCADAFRLNMSFTWTPNAPVSYTYKLLGREHTVKLPIGIAYSGLCYATGVTNATCGHVYKILNYYDLETGTLDVAAMGDNFLNIVSSACSYGAMQAWNRVSNSHKLAGMNSYSQYVSGIVPVGPYTYEAFTYNYDFGSRTASNEIIAANGNAVMYESFANMKMADGVYSSSSWHVMMCAQDPVVVRLSDGSVDASSSYVLMHEQGGANAEYAQENGVTIRPLGTIERKYSFKKLLDQGYIPFTIKEFIGQDPVEPGKAWLGQEQAPLENGTELTVRELFGKTLFANYNLCTVQVQVKAPDGTVLVRYNPHLNTSPEMCKIGLAPALRMERLEPYADGKNTVHIYAQLANGELVEAFYTTLVIQ